MRLNIKIILLLLILLQCRVFAITRGSPHDLSAIGTQDTCGYCHTPHGTLANKVGWNHKLSEVVYTIYQSSSLDAKIGQPTGKSKLCLSCHDGTVALNHTKKGGTGGVFITPGTSNLGTDLSDDHPISLVYSEALSAKDPQIKPVSSLPSELKLDRGGELQCTTCHDAHDNQHGDFLVMSNSNSKMCLSCHAPYGWDESSHQSSAASVSSAKDSYLKKSKYSTVAQNGCLSCHRPHSAGGHERLLHFERSESNCLSCHDGSVAKSDLQSDLTKFSSHNVIKYKGIHDLRESPLSSPEHVECVDCHNPHASNNNKSHAPELQGAMDMASGITSTGSITAKAQYEYEVCFKCHADNPNRVISSITRQIVQSNTRFEFDPVNPSFHPVVTTGLNKNVPSLRNDLTVSSMIYCTDCHSSDSSGTVGPHGSIFSYLLKSNYETKDYTTESQYAYDLCYTCHSRNSLINNESFPKHNEHLTSQTPCSACHDPHGISSTQGNSTNNSHLINFDTSIVSENSLGSLEFVDTGTFTGECSLSCHNIEHINRMY